MLSQPEYADVLIALKRWAATAPDKPLAGVLGQEELLTPFQIVEAVQSETPEGRAFVEILEHGIRREGIESVLSRLTRAVESSGTVQATRW